MRSSPARGALPMTTWEKRVPKTASTFALANFSTTSAPRFGSVPSSSNRISTGRPLMPPSALSLASAAVAVRSYQRP